MGRKEQFTGVYPRSASILISFQWEGVRYRESLDLRPTIQNQRAAHRIREEILSLIQLDKFTWDDFAEHFPKSPRLKGDNAPSTTLFSNLSTIWCQLIAPEVTRGTLTEYENALNRYFLPIFGNRPIKSITYEELAIYLSGLNIKAAKTFNNIMTPLRGVFAYALKTGKISHDITKDIPSRKGQKPLPDPLSPQEVDIILAHIKKSYGEEWLNYFEFAFFTGLRPSEQIALRWNSVDFRQEQARIEKARVRFTDKETKTHTARDIDLQSRALNAIKRQKAYTFLADDHVFLNPGTSEYFSDTSSPLNVVWKPTLKAVGIRHRDARQTRHTFATLCLIAGMNPAYVSRQMGHTNPRMFFEVYSKWIDGEASHREKSKMDALFAQEEPNKRATS